jgi:NADH:ubiquinone oxidoreductase subunit C
MMKNEQSNPVVQSDTDAITAAIESALGDRSLDAHRPSGRRIFLEVDPAEILETSRVLSVKFSGRLQTASAVDAPGKIEILYHWAFDRHGLVATIRTRVNRDEATIDSITSACPAAEWIEREMWELMGITFTGHPDLRHLLLADDWPAGRFPLRRDYRRE